MKLRNLVFGSMIALAFTACSENDPPVEPGTDPVAKATTLSLKLAPVTKADVAGDQIESLYVVVATEGGTIEAIAEATEAQINARTVDGIALTPGTKSVVVLANVPEDVIGSFAVGTSSLDELLETAADLTYSTEGAETPAENDDELFFSMNSKIHEGITIYEGENHYLGYIRNDADGNVFYDADAEDVNQPVRLYRNVAKINLSGITMGNVVYMDRAHATPLHNAKLMIDEIAIVQSMAKSKLVGAGFGEWASTFVEEDVEYVSGYTDEVYNQVPEEDEDEDDFETGESFAKIEDYAGTQIASYHRPYPTPLDVTGYNAAPIDPFFVYENTNQEGILTLLTIKGTVSGYLKWEDTDEDDEIDTGELSEPVSIADRYYTVAVGITGFEGGDTPGFTVSNGNYNDITPRAGRVSDDPVRYLGVLRNLQYNISVTLNGRGSPSPFGPPPGDGELGDLDVQVVVVEWGTVTQVTPIE